MNNKRCWLCGANGHADPLEKHHIFGAAYRKKSERYGLVVYLCGNKCHRNGPNAVHNSKETMKYVHEYGQKKAMEENGWTITDFIQQFGKNYIGV